MGKVVVINHLTLDGVMQSPGRAEEDSRDGFTQGGWSSRTADDQVVATTWSTSTCCSYTHSSSAQAAAIQRRDTASVAHPHRQRDHKDRCGRSPATRQRALVPRPASALPADEEGGNYRVPGTGHPSARPPATSPKTPHVERAEVDRGATTPAIEISTGLPPPPRRCVGLWRGAGTAGHERHAAKPPSAGQTWSSMTERVPRYCLRTSMVRRGRRFESVRGLPSSVSRGRRCESAWKRSSHRRE